MKKIIAVVIIGVLLCSGLGAFGTATTGQHLEEKTQSVTFSQPVIQDQGRYILVKVDNTNAWVRTVGAPMLPVTVTTYTFPFGTRIKTVAVTFSDPQTYTLDKPIGPTPAPVTIDGTTITAQRETPALGRSVPGRAI